VFRRHLDFSAIASMRELSGQIRREVRRRDMLGNIKLGAGGIRQWRSYRRDIVADFERVYGAAPGRLIGVAVVTDSDNTRQQIRAWYGDIRMLARNP
jgi:hypothetical protein